MARNRPQCGVPGCDKPAHKWPGQPPEPYCAEHNFEVNHAIVRGDSDEVRKKLGLTDRSLTDGT